MISPKRWEEGRRWGGAFRGTRCNHQISWRQLRWFQGIKCSMEGHELAVSKLTKEHDNTKDWKVRKNFAREIVSAKDRESQWNWLEKVISSFCLLSSHRYSAVLNKNEGALTVLYVFTKTEHFRRWWSSFQHPFNALKKEKLLYSFSFRRNENNFG